MSTRFIKLDTRGQPLADDAPEWSAVLDAQSNLIWDAGEHERMNWKAALEYPKSLAIGGFTDWRLPTVEELFCLADRTKVDPAIDTAFFSKCKADWYWTSTPYAASPGDCAWLVSFGGGDSGCGLQSYKDLVRAVRSRQ